nr:hypothetical protein [Akkermansiaceae bacterium]
VDAAFSDLLNYPRGSPPATNPDPLLIAESVLPGARHISNALSSHPRGVPSKAGLTSWTWQWGQFIDHDFGLSASPGPGEPRESFPIPVPPGDPDFDPANTGAMVIPFTRSGLVPGTGDTGRRETPNQITSYLDGSGIYGSDDLRALNLRSFSGGKLATQPGPDGELSIFNLYGRDNANDLGLPSEDLLLAGDVRANEQCALTAMHTLFVREHNRLAREIAARDFPGADLSDPAVDTEIYEQARKFVGAFIQNITYQEFLPVILGADALPSYAGYDQDINAALSQEFANAAYRVGHSMVTPELLRFDQFGDPLPQGHLPLRHAFFNPAEITEIGVGPYLRGLAQQVQQEIDRFVIEDVRSFLFGPPGAGGLDLAALNIQRGRDHGLPSYRAVREAYGLPPATSYRDITSNLATIDGFEAAYGPGQVTSVDLWIGGISEDHLPGSQLGPTFHAIWTEQFTRLRDGDRFWFENDPFFSPEELEEIRQTTLADLIRRNSNAEVQDNVFLAPRRLEIVFFDFDRPSSTVTITWRSEGGEPFEIQASDDFARHAPFTRLTTTTGTPGTTTAIFVDPGTDGKPRRAYRVVEP